MLAQCARWRALLTEEIVDGRQLLREVLDGPMTFTPGPGKQYRFSGNVMTGQLVAGLVSPKTPPEMASLMPASWNQITTWLKTMDELKRAA